MDSLKLGGLPIEEVKVGTIKGGVADWRMIFVTTQVICQVQPSCTSSMLDLVFGMLCLMHPALLECCPMAPSCLLLHILHLR